MESRSREHTLKKKIVTKTSGKGVWRFANRYAKPLLLTYSTIFLPHTLELTVQFFPLLSPNFVTDSDIQTGWCKRQL